ncbi:radial spoke head protein 9 homolog [Kryptolebias marmoratus]|uniref:Radial spoke head protein 9 homolog n=1 Tax=Kryptolebias marmoratus TaxID=37003 RepID=A0A3Q3B6Z9_KRYMA|nr:radial spoke head protein 9 homolog [Kryptolebias marmoratus]
MDSDSLYYSLDLVPGCGNILSAEQRAALQTSLAILKKNYKFQRVLFWGKIMGLTEDYLIAQGRGEDEMKDRKYLYSFNCMDWFLLPTITDSMIEQVAKAAKGCFTGDPSFVYEPKTHSYTAADNAADEDAETKVTEEKRLAVTVHHIDEEVSVVPRGAFIKTPHGLVQTNCSFGGLSDSEARKLHNFMHFSQPRKSQKKSILKMGEWSPAIDFLDVLTDDTPKGSWSLQFQCASKVCVLHSLLWLGLTFYHVPMTPQHGYIYIGDGLKSLDLPFML